MMNLVFANDQYQVLEYPELNGFELLNTRLGTGVFLSGEMARVFRQSIEGLRNSNPTEEDVEGVIGNFDALMTHRLIYH
ncbi:DUF3567 family protein [Thiobacter aerophilum]|uniref:DUF3567 family protein n=1 Tax=Thiobacter aerophilum TaxID=3121275 RepID=A0ABV0ED45_9BURK